MLLSCFRCPQKKEGQFAAAAVNYSVKDWKYERIRLHEYHHHHTQESLWRSFELP